MRNQFSNNTMGNRLTDQRVQQVLQKIEANGDQDRDKERKVHSGEVQERNTRHNRKIKQEESTKTPQYY